MNALLVEPLLVWRFHDVLFAAVVLVMGVRSNVRVVVGIVIAKDQAAILGHVLVGVGQPLDCLRHIDILSEVQQGSIC